MKCIIRCAKLNDCKAIHALIKELAILVKAEDRLKITPNQLEKDGFGSSPNFKAFVAEENNKIVGTAIFFEKYSTWKGKSIYLEDLVVKKTHRGKNIGTLLFNAVRKYAKENSAQRMDWQIYSFNKPALKFYKKHNATLEEGWVNGYIQKDNL